MFACRYNLIKYLFVPHGFHRLRVHGAEERVAGGVISALFELSLIEMDFFLLFLVFNSSLLLTSFSNTSAAS